VIFASSLLFLLVFGPFGLVLIWTARFRAAVAQADGFSSLTWRDFIPRGERRFVDPGLASAILELEATPRPEPGIERLRRQLQSFWGQTVAMMVGGFFIASAWAELVGLPDPFGISRSASIDPVRIVFWTVALVLTFGALFAWVMRQPAGFAPTFVVGLFVSVAWVGALAVVGPL
jgi:hypothetical protein